MAYCGHPLNFGHDNIRKYCNRPFASAKEMDEAIIENWNKVVKAGDIVWHLGDFCWGRYPADVERYLKRLNGNVCLIYGNHDRQAVRRANGFSEKRDLRRIKINDQEIILCHYAMRVWDKSHFGSWHCYGHTHGTLEEPKDSLSCDVGVDAWDFTPVSFDQIKAHLSTREFTPINKR